VNYCTVCVHESFARTVNRPVKGVWENPVYWDRSINCDTSIDGTRGAAGNEDHLYVVPATNLSLLEQLIEPSILNSDGEKRLHTEG
jgi:hypothetical protein